MKGKFITFEGCEGSGKSTQITLLCDYLDKTGQSYIVTREPGGTSVAEKIRTIILDGKNTSISDECEALLYAAARAQHVKEIILPALNAGKLVVCDRYIDSSLAYQGFARGLGERYVNAVNAYALENCMPDLTLFLNISPESAFCRKHGADKNDRIESLGLEFHKRVYEGYLTLLKKNPRICAVDCSGTRENTHKNVITILREKGIIR